MAFVPKPSDVPGTKQSSIGNDNVLEMYKVQPDLVS